MRDLEFPSADLPRCPACEAPLNNPTRTDTSPVICTTCGHIFWYGTKDRPRNLTPLEKEKILHRDPRREKGIELQHRIVRHMIG